MRVDRSAVVLNPATLAFPAQNGSGISFNGLTYNYHYIDYRNALGPGNDVGVTLANVLPGMVAGEVQSPLPRKLGSFGYALFQRGMGRAIYNGLSSERTDFSDAEGWEGEEELIGRYELLSDLRETVGVFGAGHRLSKNWGFGWSLFGIYRNHLFEESAQFDLRPGNTESPYGVSTGLDRGVLLYQASVQLKTGLSWQTENWSAGLTFTLPALSVYRSARLNYDRREMAALPDTSWNLQVTSDRDGIKSRYKYPLSAAFGLSRRSDDWSLSLSLHFDSRISEYAVLPETLPEILRPDEPSTYTPGETAVRGSNRAVFNWSVAASKSLSENVQLLLSVRSNLSFARGLEPEQGFRLERMRWDLYHLNLGAHYTWRRTEWLVGAQLTYGSSSASQRANSEGLPDPIRFLENLTAQGEVRQYGAAAILSFALNFGQAESKL
jgi:hypothetical protein